MENQTAQPPDCGRYAAKIARELNREMTDDPAKTSNAIVYLKAAVKYHDGSVYATLSKDNSPVINDLGNGGQKTCPKHQSVIASQREEQGDG